MWDDQALSDSYDRVAGAYAEAIYDELSRKPADRALLDDFAEHVRALGPVWDIGCGPGHAARYVRDRDVDVHGLDRSAGMVEVATRLNPDIPFHQGSMLQLPCADASLGGIVCMYALIHLPRDVAPQVLREFRRALRPGGRLLLAVHAGEGEIHNEYWFEQAVDVHVTLYRRDELVEQVQHAGFEIVDAFTRPPYPEEYQSQRLYITAIRPADDADTIPPATAPPEANSRA